MAFTTWSDGDVLTATALNANMLPTKIAEIYTGTDFDISDTSAGTHTDNHTLSLTSGELDNATYVLVYLTYVSQGFGGTSVTNSIQVQRAQSGGAFSDALAETYTGQSISTTAPHYTVATLIVPITLTAGEKSAGLDVKILTKVAVAGTATTAILRNSSVILKLSY